MACRTGVRAARRDRPARRTARRRRGAGAPSQRLGGGLRIAEESGGDACVPSALPPRGGLPHHGVRAGRQRRPLARRQRLPCARRAPARCRTRGARPARPRTTAPGGAGPAGRPVRRGRGRRAGGRTRRPAAARPSYGGCAIRVRERERPVPPGEGPSVSRARCSRGGGRPPPAPPPTRRAGLGCPRRRKRVHFRTLTDWPAAGGDSGPSRRPTRSSARTRRRCVATTPQVGSVSALSSRHPWSCCKRFISNNGL